MTEEQKITTIKIDGKTKNRLDKLKIHKRQSYDELVQEILNILNICRVNPEQARSRLKRIDKIQALTKKPKTYSEAREPQNNPQS